jgi:hypothetical protein
MAHDYKTKGFRREYLCDWVEPAKAESKPEAFSGGLRCGKTTLMAEHAARAINGDHGGTYAPPTRWQDGALAEEHMRVPTQLEVEALAYHGRVAWSPTYKSRATVVNANNEGHFPITISVQGAFKPATLADLRVPRMPEIGSRWTDSTGQIHIVRAHLPDYRVEALLVERFDVCEYSIENWHAQMRPAPSKCVVYAENIRPGQHVAMLGFVATVAEVVRNGPDLLDLTVQRPLDDANHYVFPTLSFARRELIEVLTPAEYIEREAAYRADPQWPSEDMRQAYRDRLVRKVYAFKYDAVFEAPNELPLTSMKVFREAVAEQPGMPDRPAANTRHTRNSDGSSWRVIDTTADTVTAVCGSNYETFHRNYWALNFMPADPAPTHTPVVTGDDEQVPLDLSTLRIPCVVEPKDALLISTPPMLGGLRLQVDRYGEPSCMNAVALDPVRCRLLARALTQYADEQEARGGR